MVDVPGFAAVLSATVAVGHPEGARRICELCVEVLGVAGAAVSVMSDPDRREVVYASDPVATELEELQFGLGEGPCVEAFGTGRPVLVADLDAGPDPRWPMFAAAARARTSARAAFAFPLQVGAIRIGVLDLYRLEPGLLGAGQLAGALLAADAILWSLLNRADGAAGDGPPAPIGEGGGAGPWPVVLHRDHSTVYQATGMIMMQAGLPAAASLARLRAFAYAADRPIEAVATDVVARRLRFDRTGD